MNIVIWRLNPGLEQIVRNIDFSIIIGVYYGLVNSVIHLQGIGGIEICPLTEVSVTSD